VGGDSGAHYLAYALVVVGSGREGVKGCEGELGFVSEALTGSTKLLLNQALETHHIVLIGDLVHLSVYKELVGLSIKRWYRWC
jgi:hypothetical protein